MDWFTTNYADDLKKPYLTNLATYCDTHSAELYEKGEDAEFTNPEEYATIFYRTNARLAEIACNTLGIVFDDQTTQEIVQKAVEAISAIVGWDFSSIFYYAENENFEEQYWTQEDRDGFFYSASIYFANAILEKVLCCWVETAVGDSPLTLRDIYSVIQFTRDNIPSWSMDRQIAIDDLPSLFAAGCRDAQIQEAEFGGEERTVHAIPFTQLTFMTNNQLLEPIDEWYFDFAQVAEYAVIDNNKLLFDTERLLKTIQINEVFYGPVHRFKS